MAAPKNLMNAGQVPKDVRKLLKELAADGVEVELHGSGHFRVTPPNGEAITISASPKNPHLTLVRLRKLQKELV